MNYLDTQSKLFYDQCKENNIGSKIVVYFEYKNIKRSVFIERFTNMINKTDFLHNIIVDNNGKYFWKRINIIIHEHLSFKKKKSVCIHKEITKELNNSFHENIPKWKVKVFNNKYVIFSISHEYGDGDFIISFLTKVFDSLLKAPRTKNILIPGRNKFDYKLFFYFPNLLYYFFIYFYKSCLSSNNRIYFNNTNCSATTIAKYKLSTLKIIKAKYNISLNDLFSSIIMKALHLYDNEPDKIYNMLSLFNLKKNMNIGTIKNNSISLMYLPVHFRKKSNINDIVNHISKTLLIYKTTPLAYIISIILEFGYLLFPAFLNNIINNLTAYSDLIISNNCFPNTYDNMTTIQGWVRPHSCKKFFLITSYDDCVKISLSYYDLNIEKFQKCFDKAYDIIQK